MKALKISAIILIALVITNMIALALGWITPLLFWVVIIGAALLAFYVIPNMNKARILGK
jgi:hypothetical protein